MKHRGTVYSMYLSMARSNVCMCMEWMLVSISDCGSRLKPWSDFNADDNRQDFYCENTCLATWPEVTFWPGGRDVWPLYSDIGTFIQQEGVRGWTTFERSWLADSGTKTLFWGNIVLFGLDPGPSSWFPLSPDHHETHDLTHIRSLISIICEVPIFSSSYKWIVRVK